LTSARLPLEEPYPENLAHVWGDNFEKDGAYRDITFLPRASHDSIGCPGAFMTPGDLARWTHALFHGEVISRESLAEMQTFGTRGSYGLGLQRFERMRTGGMRAFGHGGGSIGTEAYMVYMPDHDVCIALMVNHFGGKCSSVMLRDIGTITIRHLKPHALLLSFWSVESWMSLAWLLTGAGAVVYAMRRKRPAVLVVFGGVAVASGWVSTRHFVSLAMVLIPEGALLLFAGALWHVRRRMSRAGGGPGRA
jgi:CubicO group peptidase (beta-lactamase class C family)